MGAVDVHGHFSECEGDIGELAEEMTPRDFRFSELHEILGHVTGRATGTQGQHKIANDVLALFAEGRPLRPDARWSKLSDLEILNVLRSTERFSGSELETLAAEVQRRFRGRNIPDQQMYDFCRALQLKSDGGLVHKFNQGGIVPGRGSQDTVNAKLTPGEAVIPRWLVQLLTRNQGEQTVRPVGEILSLTRRVVSNVRENIKVSTSSSIELKSIRSAIGVGNRLLQQQLIGIKDLAWSAGSGGIYGFNQGGRVPGVGNEDTIPAMLTPGEFVVKKIVAQKYANELTAINNGGNAQARHVIST